MSEKIKAESIVKEVDDNLGTMKKCNYCNRTIAIGDWCYKDEDIEQLCHSCYELEIAHLCPTCENHCDEADVNYNYITLEDGLYFGKVEWGMGSVLREQLKKVSSKELETFVHGICNTCAKEVLGDGDE